MWLPTALLFAIQLTPDPSEGPYRQPQLAAGDGIVALAFGSGRPTLAVHASVSRDQGKTFSKPVKVAQPGFVSIGRHRGPRVAVASGAIIIAACVGKQPPAQRLNLMAWRSTDGGLSWSEGVRINDVAESAGEGFHGLAARGNLAVAVWLDVPGGGVYLAKSTDGGASWSKNRLVYNSPAGHVCECCHPSVQIGPDGRIFVMWRNWLDGARDMYLATSTDGAETFRVEKLGQGTWPLNACPQDGGGLALDPRGNPVTVWRRAGSVFLASPGRPEQELGEGSDPVVAVSADGKVYSAWMARQGWKWRVSNQPSVTVEEQGTFPSLLAASPVLAAWQSQSGISVQPLAEPVLRPEIPEKVSPIERIDVTAADGETSFALIRKPPGAGPFPAIVFLHGSLYTFAEDRLRREALEGPTHTRFLAAGYVTVTGTRRNAQKDPQAPQYLDVLALIEGVKKLPYVDPGSIVAMGGSGGGSLALEIATRTRLAAIAAGEPASVLFTGMLHKDSPRPPEMMADPHKFYTPELRRLTREKIARLACPVLIAHGDVHAILKINKEILVPELKAAGKQVEMIVYPGQPHGFYFGRTPDQPAAKKSFEDCDAFFRRRLARQPVAMNPALLRYVPSKPTTAPQ